MIHYSCKKCGYSVFIKPPDDGKPYYFLPRAICKTCETNLMVIPAVSPGEKVYTENMEVKA